MIERRQLKLSLPLTVVTEQDRTALAKAALTAQLPPDAAEQMARPADDAAKRKRIAAYEKAYKDVIKSPPEYPAATTTEQSAEQKSANLDAKLQYLEHALLERLKPDSEALNALAQQRARAAQDALLANTELDPERVYITGERSEGKAADGDKVRMEMTLELTAVGGAAKLRPPYREADHVHLRKKPAAFDCIVEHCICGARRLPGRRQCQRHGYRQAL